MNPLLSVEGPGRAPWAVGGFSSSCSGVARVPPPCGGGAAAGGDEGVGRRADPAVERGETARTDDAGARVCRTLRGGAGRDRPDGGPAGRTVPTSRSSSWGRRGREGDDAGVPGGRAKSRARGFVPSPAGGEAPVVRLSWPLGGLPRGARVRGKTGGAVGSERRMPLFPDAEVVGGCSGRGASFLPVGENTEARGKAVVAAGLLPRPYGTGSGSSVVDTRYRRSLSLGGGGVTGINFEEDEGGGVRSGLWEPLWGPGCVRGWWCPGDGGLFR